MTRRLIEFPSAAGTIVSVPDYADLITGATVKKGALTMNAGTLYRRNADGTVEASFTGSAWTAVQGGTGATVAAANTFTAKQTIDAGTALVLKKISTDGSVAPELHFASKNGLGPNNEPLWEP